MATKERTTAGSESWQLPANAVGTVTAAVRGSGGGGGGGSTTGSGGGGGAGGAYAAKSFTVGVDITAGNYYDIVVGSIGTAGSGANDGVDGGDSYFISATDVMAKGGGHGGYGGGTAGHAGVAPANTASVGTTRYAGGAGAIGQSNGGGGGGEGGCSNATGASASGSTAGSSAGDGGDGANGATTGTPSAGTAPGGGGGGSNDAASSSGSAGGVGRVTITYTTATTWEGTLTCAGTTAVSATGATTQATWEGTLTVAGTTAVSVTGATTQATWEGTLTVAGATAVTVTGTHTDAIPYTSSLTSLSSSTDYHVRAWATNSGGTSYGNEVDFTSGAAATTWEGTFTCAGTSAVSVAESSTEAVWEGSFTVPGTSSVSITAGLTHATWEGSFACNGTTAVSVTGAATQATWEGTLTCAGTTAVLIVGTTSEAVWEGSFVCAGTTAVSVSATPAQAVWEGSFTCPGVSAVNVTGSKDEPETWEGSFTCAGVTAVSVAESSTEAVWEGTLTCAGTTAVSVVATPTQAIWEGSFTTVGITAVSVSATTTQAIWEGSFTVAGISTVSASGSKGTAWEGSLTCAGVSAVSIIATPTQAVWEGSFTCAGISAVTVTVASSSYVSALTDLTAATHYYVRAWATSADGTGYGSEVEFDTISDTATGSAMLVIAVASEETEGSALLHYLGEFFSTLEFLTAGTHYYVRAWAQSDDGPGYGDEIEFDSALAPQSDAEGSAHLTSTMSSRDASGEAYLQLAGYSSALSSLLSGTYYYVRAWAQNDEGVRYGSEVAFTTDVNGEWVIGSALLSEMPVITADGSAVLLQTARSFTGLMGSLFHARMRASRNASASGIAVLQAERLFSTDGSAQLNASGEYDRQVTGSALLAPLFASFHGLMGGLFHARKGGARESEAGGSAWLGTSPLPYAYGSAYLLRRRTADASGDAVLSWWNPRGSDAEGTADLQAALESDVGGEAMLIISSTQDATGEAVLVQVPEGSVTGTAQLLNLIVDGMIDGSAVLAHDHEKSVYGSAMLRTVYKGKTRHPRRRQAATEMTPGGKVAHMKRSSRKGMMDQWP